MNRNETSNRIQILLVEDSPTDADLTREGLLEANVAANLRVLPDGAQAIRYLRREGEYAEAERPDVILLDLKLPGRSGMEVLLEIKGDRALREIPVIVLTTSAAEEDIRRSYQLHANSYMIKPLGLDEFIDLMRRFGDYWFSAVRLPGQIGHA